MPKVHFLPTAITMDAAPGETLLQVAARAGLLVVAPCGGRGVCCKCLVEVDGKTEIACQYQVQTNITVTIPIHHLGGGKGERVAADLIMPYLAQTPKDAGPFLALDLGTTGVGALWVDPATGTIKRGGARNRQTTYGADVLSRIMSAEEGGETTRQELRLLASQSLLEAISALGEITPVSSVALSANPTMIHLLLGWDASGIRLIPPTPHDLIPPPLPITEVLGEHKVWTSTTEMQILPATAGYLGGDVLAGAALMRLLSPEKKVQMLIDAGTNGEIVLWAEGALIGIATSAGPAFEGGEVYCGMPAAPGAIERLVIPESNLWAEYETIGATAPRGLCGSGIIELVAELDRQGALERTGRLRNTLSLDCIMPGKEGMEYIIVPPHATAHGKAITLSDADLDCLISTKAAIFAGCRRLVKALGLELNDIEQVFIAGDFGAHINLEAAIRLGMLPDVSLEKYVFLGNAGLAGAMLSLIKPGFSALVKELALSTTYLDLSTDMDFVEEYVAARFLPHTDMGLFPSLI